jgi:hypothetical protein
MSDNAQAIGVFRELRRFVRPRAPSGAQCELCGADIGDRHHHLLQLKTRQIACGCQACAILFSDQAAGSYRRIPTDIRALPDFVMDDAQWEELAIPINMAFFCRIGDSTEPAAFYPSPAGATEAHLGVHSWQHIVDQNPLLQRMASDVEALLVNRLSQPHEYFIVPIDECYRLIGLIRTQWRGFSGGKDVWESISGFFTSLRNRAVRAGATHA